MHPLMATVLLRMTWRDPLQLDAKAEPPHRELAEAIEGMRGGKRQPVIGSNPSRETKFFERALEHGKGKFLLCRRQRLTRQQIPAGEIRDGERIAVLPIAEQELAFIVRAPQRVRVGGARKLGAIDQFPRGR